MYRSAHLRNPVVISFVPVRGSVVSYRNVSSSARRFRAGPPCWLLSSKKPHRCSPRVKDRSIRDPFVTNLFFHLACDGRNPYQLSSSSCENEISVFNRCNGCRGGTFFSSAATLRPIKRKENTFIVSDLFSNSLDDTFYALLSIFYNGELHRLHHQWRSITN